MDGNGIFNPDIDKLVTLKSEPKVETAQGNTLVTFSPTALNEIVNENVDGIYDSDPVKNPAAKRFATITYKEILEKNLKVMDLTAVSLCMDSKMPILVFNMKEDGAIKDVLCGKDKGTTVTV